MSGPQTVLIIGATGRTGSVIADALLNSISFEVIAVVRPDSIYKRSLAQFEMRGLRTRTCDMGSASPEALADVLQDVDIVISCVWATELEPQKRVVDACKSTGVKRFIPSCWSTACVEGVMMLHDLKIQLCNYVRQSGVDYTFVDVGWWMESSLPCLDPSKAYNEDSFKYLQTVYGSGDVKTAVTDRIDTGRFVERILSDPRTLNRYVFIWSEEVTQNETFALAERITGRKLTPSRVNREEAETRIAEAQKCGDWLEVAAMQYYVSIWMRGDNTVENAKKEQYGDALDARELYPDLQPRELEVCARELYADLA